MGLAAEESICNNTTNSTECVDERLMTMRFEIRDKMERVYKLKSPRTKPIKRSGMPLTMSYNGSRRRNVYMC